MVYYHGYTPGEANLISKLNFTWAASLSLTIKSAFSWPLASSPTPPSPCPLDRSQSRTGAAISLACSSDRPALSLSNNLQNVVGLCFLYAGQEAMSALFFA